MYNVIDAGFVQNIFNGIATVGGFGLAFAFAWAYLSSTAGRATSWGSNKKWW